MALSKIRLGDYIVRSTKNNRELKYGADLISGVTSQGVFAVPKGDPIDVNLKPYKIVNDGAFVYNPTRLNLGSIAYRTDGLCIVSHLYMVFYLNEAGKKIINPLWLYIYFRRDEFLREVTFRNFGSQRPEFNFEDMSDIIIPLPNLPTQQKYVDIYNAMVANQQAYERGLDDLKLTCDAYIEDLRRNMFKVPQHKRFFEFIFSSNQPDELKNEYLSSFGKLASLDDSLAFQKLVCKEENMKLLGSHRIFNRIHRNLWELNRGHKGVFTRKWNECWKDKLDETHLL